MNVQYQDPRQPLQNPQQESIVQRIRQQVEAHPNLVALFVAAVGVGLALWWYTRNGGSIGGSSGSTTSTGTDTSSGTGSVGTTSGSSGSGVDVTGLQNMLNTFTSNLGSTLSNFQSGIQQAIVTNAANASNGSGTGQGTGTGPGNLDPTNVFNWTTFGPPGGYTPITTPAAPYTSDVQSREQPYSENAVLTQINGPVYNPPITVSPSTLVGSTMNTSAKSNPSVLIGTADILPKTITPITTNSGGGGGGLKAM